MRKEPFLSKTYIPDPEAQTRHLLVTRLSTFFEGPDRVVWHPRLQEYLCHLVTELTGNTRVARTNIERLNYYDLRLVKQSSRRMVCDLVLETIGLHAATAEQFLLPGGWAHVRSAMDDFCEAAERVNLNKTASKPAAAITPPPATLQSRAREWDVSDVARRLLRIVDRTDYGVFVDLLAISGALGVLRARANALSTGGATASCEATACVTIPVPDIRLQRTIDRQRFPAAILRKLGLTAETGPSLLGAEAWQLVATRFDEAAQTS